MTFEPYNEQPGLRMVIYIGESDRWQNKPLYAAILELLKKKGMAGATVTRGVAGFGAHSRIHTAAILRLSEDLPLRIEVIDTPEKINGILEAVSAMVTEGLITIDDVHIVRYTHRYLNPLPADKPVKDVMTTEVLTLTQDMTIAQAWTEMLRTTIKAMPVVNDGRRVVGFLTDEDIIKCCGDLAHRLSVAQMLDATAVQEGLASLQTSKNLVKDVMSTPAITAEEDEPLGVAAARMAKHGIKRLPVIDKDGRLVGVLSRSDVLWQVMKTEKKSARHAPPPGAAHTVRDVMRPDVPSVKESDSLEKVIAAFLRTDLHRVIVTDEQGQPVGLISDADAVTRIAPEEQEGVFKAFRRKEAMPPSSTTAREIMSPGVLTARPETSVLEAAYMMMNAGRKWLVVVDQEQKVQGLVDRHILLRALSG